MPTTQQYLDYSLLSFAAYAKDLTPSGGLSNIDNYVLEKFTQTQAEKFIASGWEVINQSDDAKYGSSGFSATLFHNTQTGEYVFANRGTDEIVSDLLDADVWGIVVNGAAGTQIIDMYRYYKQLITPENQVVTYTAEEIEKLRAVGGAYHLPFNTTALVESYVQNDIGLGKISSTQTFSTTGHSLGGHLSLWLSNYLLPTAVTDTYTYNGAGIGSIFSSAVTTALGAITGNPTTFVPSNNVTNLYAYGDVAVIAGVGGSVGQNFPVNIEYKTLLSNPIDYVKFYNHSIVQLTDAITVANLLNKLDPNITTAKFNDFFDKSSNKIGESLEGVLDGLRKSFGMISTTPNDNRTQFYENLYALQNSATFKSLIGHVTLVAAPTSASEARSDLGLFLSLYYLTPFALKVTDAGTLNSLYQAHDALADLWNDDRNLTTEQKANGEANFSDQYLADRALMLKWQNLINTKDFVDNNNLGYLDGGTQGLHFEDKTTQLNIDINRLFNNKQNFIFGENIGPIDADTLTGGNNADHLYGMGGNDSINGGDGNDYIEGNAGQDTLKGEAGNDTLIGGSDVDILDGGTGNDQLKGGAGVDVYQFNGNYGFDTISDSDGQGVIKIDNNPQLNGGKKIAYNVYYNETTQYTYTLSGVVGDQTLVIRKDGDSNQIIVQHWSASKNLNITLDDNITPPSVPAATRTIVGDLKPIDTDPVTSGLQEGVDDLGNVLTSGAEPDRLDTLNGSTGKDLIQGLGGVDILNGYEGDDRLEGGRDIDYLFGGTGNDTLLGGAGDSETLRGNDDDDQIYADTELTLDDAYLLGETQTGTGQLGDLLDGGAGDDTLVGAASDDMLLGGDGKDIIMGAGGDDTIQSDSEYAGGTLGVKRTVNGQFYSLSANFGFNLTMGSDDVVYAGAGDDWVLAGGGNDFIDAGIGNDVIFGEAGNDIILGQAGDDFLVGDVLQAQAANNNAWRAAA